MLSETSYEILLSRKQPNVGQCLLQNVRRYHQKVTTEDFQENVKRIHNQCSTWKVLNDPRTDMDPCEFGSDKDGYAVAFFPKYALRYITKDYANDALQMCQCQ